MIRGTVIPNDAGDLEAWVEISVADSRGVFHRIRAIVDTGFTDWLTLPSAFIRRLGLSAVGSIHATLADGSENTYQNFEGEVLWHDTPRNFAIIALDAAPLLGTKALANCRLTIDFQEGGDVIIEER